MIDINSISEWYVIYWYSKWKIIWFVSYCFALNTRPDQNKQSLQHKLMILTSSCVALSVSNSLCSVAFSWLSFCSRASRSINAAPRSGSGWVCVWHASSRSCFFSLSKICWIFCGSPLQIENKCWHVGVRKEIRLRVETLVCEQ